MNEARCFSDRLSKVGCEGDDIVIGCLLDLVDSCDGKFRAALDLFQRLTRNRSHLSVDFTDSNLHVQPFLVLGLF